MKGKYLQKNKQVITFNTLTALTMLAEAGASSIQNATGKEICDILRDGPSEIQVIVEDDEANGYASSSIEKQRAVVKVGKGKCVLSYPRIAWVGWRCQSGQSRVK